MDAPIFLAMKTATASLDSTGQTARAHFDEIREMLAARAHGCTKNLPINRTKWVEQIKMLERRRREIDRALAELRRIYTDLFIVSDVRSAGTSGPI
jgi:hypothetical protein